MSHPGCHKRKHVQISILFKNAVVNIDEPMLKSKHQHVFSPMLF